MTTIPLRPRRRTGWVWVLFCLGLLMLLALAFYVGIDQLVATWGAVPLDITIDGEQVVRGLQLGDLSEGHKLTVVATLLVLAVLLALVLPILLVALLVSLIVLALLVAAVAVGAPMLAAGAVVAVLGLLVVLPVLLLWRLVRWLLHGDRPAQAPQQALPAPSATIDG
jgi:hypothetical protein